jgi:hypothetical protein
MSRPMTRGDNDRGANVTADTPLAESAATVSAKKSRAFMVRGSRGSREEKYIPQREKERYLGQVGCQCSRD